MEKKKIIILITFIIIVILIIGFIVFSIFNSKQEKSFNDLGTQNILISSNSLGNTNTLIENLPNGESETIVEITENTYTTQDSDNIGTFNESNSNISSFNIISSNMSNTNMVNSNTSNTNNLNEGSENMNNQSEEIKVNLIVNNKNFTATLNNNETVRELLEMFPMTLNMSDLNSNEKYNYLNTTLSTNTYRPNRINAGDIKLYGNNCLVVFYESFNTSYSYTDLGKVDNVDEFVAELGSGSVSIRFELM